MLAEILAIGSELTSGAKLDTNSQWLSLQLADWGIPVGYHTTVADDLAANVEVLRIAAKRSDLVLITGGLGPTRDDLTREALAALAGVELVLDPVSLEQIELFFRTRSRPMPERNRLQAMFPQGAEVLSNPVGTAPGIWLSLPRAGREPCLLAALPGVPSEMYRMFHEQVRPRLPGGECFIRRARIHCFGLGESATEELLGELTGRGRDPEVGITAHEATITLRINAQGTTLEECERKIAITSTEIHQRLGDYVFGSEDDELEHAVVRELLAAGWKIATVESGTNGLLAHRLSAVPGSELCYLGGVVLPQLQETLTSAVERVAAQTHAEYVLGIGEESREPLPGGMVLSRIPICFRHPGGTLDSEVSWSGNPSIFRSYVMKSALKELWLRAKDARPR